MFAFFVIFFFICSKSESVLKGEQLQLSAADARGSSPLGRFPCVCLNKQIPGMQRNGVGFPQPSSPRCFLLAKRVCFGAGAAELAAHAQCRLGCSGGRWWPCRWADRAGMEPPASSAASALGVVLLYSSGGAWPDPAELLPTVCRHLG